METIDDSAAIIPGMGPEDKVDFTESLTSDRGFIPGLDLDTSQINDRRSDRDKKVPYSKPIPRNFQAQWNDTGRSEDDELMSKDMKDSITQIDVPMIPLQKVAPTAIIVYGKTIPVTRKSLDTNPTIRYHLQSFHLQLDHVSIKSFRKVQQHSTNTSVPAKSKS